MQNKINLNEGYDTVITLLEIWICESEIHRNVTSVRISRASLFSREKLILRLQKNSQHLNENLKDSRGSRLGTDGQDAELTTLCLSDVNFTRTQFVVWWQCGRETDKQCDSYPCGLWGINLCLRTAFLSRYVNVVCHFGNKGFIYKLYVKSTLIGQHFIYS